MANKLNERQRCEVVADYALCGNYSEVARKHGTSEKTVRRIVAENAELAENAEHKKEEAAEDVLTHMSKQLGKVNLIIDKYLDRLLDDNLISKASSAQLTTSLGTLIDKYTMVLKHNQGNAIEDDPITKALKEEAERMNNGDFS